MTLHFRRFMTKLHELPAFGWETISSNANDAYVDLMARRMAAKYCRQNQWVHWTQAGALYQSERSKVAQNSHWGRNFNKVMGYFPILGTIVGIYNFNVTRDMALANKNLHIFRSSVEIASCGCLLVIPDVIVTLCRSSKSAT